MCALHTMINCFSSMVYLVYDLECVLWSAHVDTRSGVIAGDLHLEDTKFEG